MCKQWVKIESKDIRTIGICPHHRIEAVIEKYDPGFERPLCRVPYCCRHLKFVRTEIYLDNSLNNGG